MLHIARALARTQLHGARSFAVTCPEPWRCLLGLLSDDSIVLCSAAMVRYARHEMGKFGPDAFARLNTRLYTDEQPFPSGTPTCSLSTVNWRFANPGKHGNIQLLGAIEDD